MKIRIKENIVGLNFSYVVGQEVDVDNALAKDLIRAKYAEEVKKRSKKSGEQV